MEVTIKERIKTIEPCNLCDSVACFKFLNSEAFYEPGGESVSYSSYSRRGAVDLPPRQTDRGVIICI